MSMAEGVEGGQVGVISCGGFSMSVVGWVSKGGGDGVGEGKGRTARMHLRAWSVDASLCSLSIHNLQKLGLGYVVGDTLCGDQRTGCDEGKYSSSEHVSTFLSFFELQARRRRGGTARYLYDESLDADAFRRHGVVVLAIAVLVDARRPQSPRRRGGIGGNFTYQSKHHPTLQYDSSRVDQHTSLIHCTRHGSIGTLVVSTS